jgi:predicted flap endonuclease-1-like 5' DNA nuclease
LERVLPTLLHLLTDKAPAVDGAATPIRGPSLSAWSFAKDGPTHPLDLASPQKGIIEERDNRRPHCQEPGPSKSAPAAGKVDSKLQKPDRLVVITKDDLPEVLLRLTLHEIYGIGERMEQRLHRAGIFTVAQLWRSFSPASSACLNLGRWCSIWG